MKIIYGEANSNATKKYDRKLCYIFVILDKLVIGYNSP